ncbi:MAG: hypothetical protein JWR69_2656 [Pedosphaera sp.]|nr:hypothetical protein [Pedosphaera sp.]
MELFTSFSKLEHSVSKTVALLAMQAGQLLRIQNDGEGSISPIVASGLDGLSDDMGRELQANFMKAFHACHRCMSR